LVSRAQHQETREPVGGGTPPRTPVDIPTYAELDTLPDVRLLAPERQADPLMAPFRARAAAVVTQTIQDLAPLAVEDLDTALEALQRLTEQERWGIWLACLGMEPDVLCEALARRLVHGERLQWPIDYPATRRSKRREATAHGEASAAD
jgi:hypothetical protein